MVFFFSSRRRHTRWNCDWSSDVCSPISRPDSRARPQSLQRGTIRNKSVPRIFTFWDGAKNNPAGKLERHVLHAVDSEIDAVIQERLVDFLREQSLSANLRQRHIENLVTGRLDRHECNGQLRPALFQLVLGPVCLPESQGATACSQAERADVHCGLTLKILRMSSARSAP